VTDFGLAKATDSDDLTRTGDIIGTVRYMAPERFEGHCDARSDVYALGLTLYELLARRPAFERSDRAELIRQVTHEAPPRLQSLDPTIPRDLETVVHKAIEREPARRYGDAGALAADLRRYVEGRPIRARRVRPPEHAWRWCRRNPAVAGLAAAVFLAMAVGTTVSTGRRSGRSGANGARGPARPDAGGAGVASNSGCSRGDRGVRGPGREVTLRQALGAGAAALAQASRTSRSSRRGCGGRWGGPTLSGRAADGGAEAARPWMRGTAAGRPGRSGHVRPGQPSCPGPESGPAKLREVTLARKAKLGPDHPTRSTA
jgi:hypothetical protein